MVRKKGALPDDELLKLLYHLHLSRAFEERLSVLHRQGKAIGGIYSGVGQEAITVGACFGLRREDFICPLHRDLGALLVKGVPAKVLMAQVFGKRTGLSKGKDSYLHSGDSRLGVFGNTSMLGSNLPVACGIAYGFKLRRQDHVAIAFFGEGAANVGDVHEAMNFAAANRLAVVFVCENNLYAFSTPFEKAFAIPEVAVRAQAYGFPGVDVYGNDLLRVHGVIQEAIARARSGEGPTLVECKTFRWHGHSEHDKASYRTQEEFVEWKSRDPIPLFERYLDEKGLLTREVKDRLTKQIQAEIDEAVAFAEGSPWPEGPEALEDIYASTDGPESPVPSPESRHATRGAGGGSGVGAGGSLEPRVPGRASGPGTQDPGPGTGEEEVTYLEAIRQALWEEMERDESVFCLGEDIGPYGGAFQVTKGFVEKFGEARCLDTPISESCIVGAAVGASLLGFRPVAEMQFGDFISCGFDQVVNQAATLCYRYGGRESVPIVIRCPAGAGVGGGLYHSQDTEAWFAHRPGLKVVYPATPFDAKGLLKAAIRDPNPVVYFEHKGLYRRARGPVGGADTIVPLGSAEVKRPGTDVTVITYGAMVPRSLAAAEGMAAQGVSVEVLDLRTLAPLDRTAILASARKTSKVLIVHEAVRTCGVGAEVAALIAEEAFEDLDGPIVRLTWPDAPMAPFSPPLEEYCLPNEDRILAALRKLAAY